VDIIGLDTWALVSRNVHEAASGDPWRDRFLPPDYQVKMMERGWLGEKSGQGFYRRVGKGKDREIHAIDWKTLEYHPVKKASFPAAESARKISGLPERLRTLVASSDRAGTFLWKLFSDLLLYSAERVPEISDRIVEIDRAMRWGYAHSLGPFELWDALGVEAMAKRIEQDGRALPANVQRMLASGAGAFYRTADAEGQPRTEYFNLTGDGYRLLEERPGVLDLGPVKRARGVVKSNAGASLVDVGDGVLCLEFHRKMNALGEDQFSMIHAGLEETSRNFQAMIIANQGEMFSAGADLTPIAQAAGEGKWGELDSALRRRQEAATAIKYARKPVVAAPFSRTLGGACEIVLPAARTLIPAGGGTKELLLRLGDAGKAFELIGLSKISSSAEDARQMGLLRDTDGMSMNPERLIADAKALAVSLAPGYAPGLHREDIAVEGDGGEVLLRAAAWLARQGDQLTEWDKALAEKLAYVLSGGKLARPQPVSEQHLLDLEREALLSLCGDARTRARIEHMLKTGKPLRN
jgi:3-hydroxyacyl-CoA dehydrogenase